MLTVTPRTIRSDDCRGRPWKNGQGSTTELVVEPPGASLARFDWRLSVAELRGSGPFSTFPGYERIIVQLDGPPMTLTHESAHPVGLDHLVPYAFSGDDQTTCAVDGVAHDLNLIVRRNVARPTLAVHRLGDGDELVPERGAATVLYVLEGGLGAADGVHLDAGDARVTGAAELPAHRASGRSLIVAVTLLSR